MAPENQKTPSGAPRQYVASGGIRAARAELKKAVDVRNTEIITDI